MRFHEFYIAEADSASAGGTIGSSSPEDPNERAAHMQKVAKANALTGTMQNLDKIAAQLVALKARVQQILQMP